MEIKKNSRLAEIELLKKELAAVVKEKEELDRSNIVLDDKCSAYSILAEFQRGKIEAYEFVFKCIGGKDGD